MRFLRTLWPSLRVLLANRARSALAASGVAIGVAAVSLTSALGDGAQAEVMRNMGTMGTRLLVVRPTQIKRTTARRELQGFVSSLKLEDAETIEAMPQVEAAAPSAEGAIKVRTARGLVGTMVLGTTPAFFEVRNFAIGQGRLFDGDENRALARLVVLGGRIGRTLFPGEDPIGKEVRVNGAAFEVVGVLEPKGVSADGADADNQVFIPVRTALRRVFNSRSLTRIFVSVRDAKDLDLVEKEIRKLLRERHLLERRNLPDDFAIQNQLRFISAQQRTTRSLGYLTLGLAAISLLVGGTGILALMLLSVRERTPEIGLRMAVGARPRDILLQFLAEAVVLAMAGGIVGAGLGALGAWIMSSATQWPVRVSIGAGLVSLGTAAAIGLLFGALPARKAAIMPPIRALGLE